MPHKRAKQSVRNTERAKQGFNRPPSAAERDAIPKSMSRVLNAEKVQREYRDSLKKAKELEDKKNVKSPGSVAGIKHGESLKDFNRRVENEMRPSVRAAVKASSGKKRKRTATEPEADDETTAKPSTAQRARKTEFDSLPTSKRLNDIAEAPPELKRPRKAPERDSSTSNIVMSQAQKRMMELEREKAIRRYRELREGKTVVVQ